MTLFKEYKKINFNLYAKNIAKSWRKNTIFKYSIFSRKGSRKWVFYEGPPSTNGLPGIHHLLGCTIKDLYCRYNSLKGNEVQRIAGYDTHGLPIELGVEKFLNIKKEDIGRHISIYDYNKICFSSVIRYIYIWKQLTNDIGYWVDQENAYITYNSHYIETIWFILKTIYQNKYLYKGYTIQPYSPIAGTGLSSHELNIPGIYKYKVDISLISAFKVYKKYIPIFLSFFKGNIFFLAWTSTPWTLPSNTALSVHYNIKYVLVEIFSPFFLKKKHVIIAKQLVNDLLSNRIKKYPFRIINFFLGKKIVETRYEQLLPWFLPYKNSDNAFKLISSNFVTTEEGTGIVHIAPTFGYDDALTAKKNGIPSMLIWDKKKNLEVPIVNLQGRYISNIPFPFAGKYVRKEYNSNSNSNPSSNGSSSSLDVNVDIAIYLKLKSKTFKVSNYKHNYPFCWRTETPILYYPLYSWSIKTSSLIEEMIYINNSIKWIPYFSGKNRFGNWLRKLNDWNLSRSRYWGVPLPIWRSKDKKEDKIIGSLEELILEIKKSIKANFMIINPLSNFIIGKINNENYKQVDLHKPMIDNIIIVSSIGKPMQREEDLVDVWFDSGAMPFAQLHYPFKNKSKINKGKFYPADFISEGVDQTRGWFYTLHAISTMLFRTIAYKNVVSTGLVLDRNGQKMSKSKGNTLNPFNVIKTYGPDAIRWYIISNNAPWENIKFDISCLNEICNKFFFTIYNIYSFFSLYANIDRFSYKEYPLPLIDRSNLDRWILSELYFLIRKVENFYDNYDPTRSIRNIFYFITTELSNWYIRLTRKLFWKCDFSLEKIAALQTLYDILKIIAKLIAPIAPFFSDFLYKNLTSVRIKGIYNSVHLSFFPKVQKNLIDIKLQKKMYISQRISSIVLSLRKKENIKVRQPLKLMKILSLKKEYNNICYIPELIKQEVNVKKIHHLLSSKEADDLFFKEIKPNYRRLGPRFGKNMYKISKNFLNLSMDEINLLEKNKYLLLEIEGKKQKVEIKEVEISIKKKQDWAIAFEEDFIIAIYTKINKTLLFEGIIRDLLSHIQQMRKKNKLKVNYKITLYIATSSFIKKSILLNKNFICENTLSKYLFLNSSLKEGKIIEENNIKIYYK